MVSVNGSMVTPVGEARLAGKQGDVKGTVFIGGDAGHASETTIGLGREQQVVGTPHFETLPLDRLPATGALTGARRADWFGFDIGYLHIDANCKGRFRLSVINEGDHPSAAGASGVTVTADGFRFDGKTYKIDGGTTVKITCPPAIGASVIRFETERSYVTRVLRLPGLSEVPAGTFGGQPKEPPPDAPDPVVR